MRQSNFHLVLTVALAAVAAYPSLLRAEGSKGGSPKGRATGLSSAASPWLTCLQGFTPLAEPRLAVLRLGLACGPVTGLTRLARATGVVDENGPPVVLRFPAERKDCFRLFGVAGAPVDDLEVEITGPRGVRVSLTNQSRSWVVVGEGGPFCATAAGDYEARFTTHGGRGAFAAVVYRGAHMLVPGAPWADTPPDTSASGSDKPY